jgi:hypothetical protein
MNSRRLLLLGVAAVVAIALGLWIGTRQNSPGTEKERALYPELAKQIDQVTGVRIVKAGDQPGVELARRESGWVVVDRADHPADTAKLGKLLQSLADAKVFEEKTSNPEQYASLGVEDVKAAKAGGIRIDLTGAKTPVSLIVGKPALGARSVYVRRAGEKQSWLVATSIDTSSSPDAWLRKDIIDVRADRIQSANVQIEKAPAYTASKASRADMDFAVQPLPKGKILSAPSAANSFSTALTGLTLADVEPASAFEAQPRAAHATFKTFDGLIVDLDGWVREGKHYITVRPSYDAAQAASFKTPTAPPAEGAATTPATGEKKPDAPDVEAEAKSAAARSTGWTYEIPEYKYEAIFKPLDALLKH